MLLEYAENGDLRELIEEKNDTFEKGKKFEYFTELELLKVFK